MLGGWGVRGGVDLSGDEQVTFKELKSPCPQHGGEGKWKTIQRGGQPQAM